MQFLFDISHLVLIRMNASLYKGRHVHTSTYTLLPVDSSKSGNLFFFHAKRSYIYFSCPGEHSLLQSRSSPRFSSVYIRVSETEEGKEAAQGNGGVGTTTTTTTTPSASSSTFSVGKRRKSRMVGFKWICGTRFEHVSLSSGEWRVCIGTLT